MLARTCAAIPSSACVRLQLLDVFGHQSEISLVFDFMDTDLEVGLSLGRMLIVGSGAPGDTVDRVRAQVFVVYCLRRRERREHAPEGALKGRGEHAPGGALTL